MSAETAIVILAGACTLVLCVCVVVGGLATLQPPCWFQCPWCDRYFTDQGDRRRRDDPPNATVHRLMCADCADRREREEKAYTLAADDGD